MVDLRESQYETATSAAVLIKQISSRFTIERNGLNFQLELTKRNTPTEVLKLGFINGFDFGCMHGAVRIFHDF